MSNDSQARPPAQLSRKSPIGLVRATDLEKEEEKASNFPMGDLDSRGHATVAAGGSGSGVRVRPLKQGLTPERQKKGPARATSVTHLSLFKRSLQPSEAQPQPQFQRPAAAPGSDLCPEERLSSPIGLLAHAPGSLPKSILVQVASAVNVLHKAGLLHGELCAENVLLELPPRSESEARSKPALQDQAADARSSSVASSTMRGSRVSNRKSRLMSPRSSEASSPLIRFSRASRNSKNSGKLAMLLQAESISKAPGKEPTDPRLSDCSSKLLLASIGDNVPELFLTPPSLPHQRSSVDAGSVWKRRAAMAVAGGSLPLARLRPAQASRTPQEEPAPDASSSASVVSDSKGSRPSGERYSLGSLPAETRVKLKDAALCTLTQIRGQVVAHKVAGRPRHSLLAYLAPEVLLGNRPRRSSDAYAFGILMWELYTGEVRVLLISRLPLAGHLGFVLLRSEVCLRQEPRRRLRRRRRRRGKQRRQHCPQLSDRPPGPGPLVARRRAFVVPGDCERLLQRQPQAAPFLPADRRGAQGAGD